MATASLPTAPETAEGAAEAPAGGGKKLTILGAIAGLALGGAVGAFVIAPKLAPASDVAEVVVEEEGAGHEGEAKVAAAVHSVDNLVVNPANTGGSRFLLVTVSIVGKDAAAVEEIAARDAEVRDRIVDFLSGKPVTELGDPAHREALRTDLAAAIGGLFNEGVVKRILLPQFVIQ